MSEHRDTKVQQILELFKAGDYQVDPSAVAGSVIRRMTIPRRTEEGTPGASSSLRRTGDHRIRGIVSVDQGRARVAAF